MAMQVLDRALDFYEFDELLTDEQRDVRDRVRAVVGWPLNRKAPS